MIIKKRYTQTEKRVKREEWDTPSGMKAVSVELMLDSEEAAKAVGKLVSIVQDYKKIKDKEELAAQVNWAGGYIGALVVSNNITPEQADELQEIVDRVSDITYINIKAAEQKNRKRG